MCGGIRNVGFWLKTAIFLIWRIGIQYRAGCQIRPQMVQRIAIQYRQSVAIAGLPVSLQCALPALHALARRGLRVGFTLLKLP